MRAASFFETIELSLLWTLLVVLPIMETPKTLAILLYVGVWFGRRISWTGWSRPRLDLVEVSLLSMLAVSLVSTMINWPLINGFKGFRDTLTQVVIFWTIYRAGYFGPQHYKAAVAAAVGVVIGLGWGVLDVMQGRMGQLQFHSAGVVTQSAMYLGVAFCMTLGVAAISDSTPKARYAPALWWGGAIVMVVGLFLMGSRGAILATLITVLVFAVLIGRRLFWLVLAGLIAAAIVLAAALPDWFNQHRLLAKSWQTITARQSVEADQGRYDNWRISQRIIVQGDSLILGIGPRNFAAIDHSTMHFDPPLTIKPGRLNHAHNLFLNKLVEEGVLGLAAMLFFFWQVVAQLVRDHRAGTWKRWPWFAAIGALMVPVIAGSFNTPWQQEHALLAMILMAIYMSARYNNSKRDAND